MRMCLEKNAQDPFSPFSFRISLEYSDNAFLLSCLVSAGGDPTPASGRGTTELRFAGQAKVFIEAGCFFFFLTFTAGTGTPGVLGWSLWAITAAGQKWATFFIAVATGSLQFPRDSSYC